MSDPEITENVIDNSEEYTLKNRIDTDKVFKKRPVQGKVTTETPDVIMPVVEEVREPIVEEQVVEEESGGANFIYEEQSGVETVKPQKKAKRKMTEKQLEALKRGREKSLATRQAKKNVKKSINIAPEHQTTTTGRTTRTITIPSTDTNPTKTSNTPLSESTTVCEKR